MMSETSVNATGNGDEKPSDKGTGGPVSSKSADRIRIAKIVAVVAGLIGIVIALLTPFLPVNYAKTELTWPQQNSVGSVAAPSVIGRRAEAFVMGCTWTCQGRGKSRDPVPAGVPGTATGLPAADGTFMPNFWAAGKWRQ